MELIIIALVVGFILGYLARRLFVSGKAATLEAKIRSRLEETKNQEKEIVLAAKNQAADILENARKEEVSRLKEIKQKEERLIRLGEELASDRKEITHKEERLAGEIQKVKLAKEEIFEIKDKVLEELSRIARITPSQAKEEIFTAVQKNAAGELLGAMKKLELHRQEELTRKAQELIVSSMQRFSKSVVNDATTTPVFIENDEMKGRIIGKEGRNIKLFENLTGVQIIIDETPGVVTLSSFDPVRREVARLSLEKLLKDGRIQPAKIEEKIEEAKSEIQQKVKQQGENAAYELGILDLPPQIIHLLGRLMFRTSYGQNVLTHSIEVAWFAAKIGEELGLDVETLKRGGLLHDIGKSVDHEIEGSHLELGITILQRFGVNEKVVLAMRSHHDTYPYALPEAFVVTAADAISSSRPGARSDTVEKYLKRLTDLEKIATSHPEVEKAYALTGGREIRIFVVPTKIDDLAMFQLAKDIANQVEAELKYPGEIKVNVIRETQAVEYAK